MATVAVPEFSLVVFFGVSGSGIHELAGSHFSSEEYVLSADEQELEAVRNQLRTGQLAALASVDSSREVRQKLLKLAKQYHAPVVAVVLDLPEAVLLDLVRNVSGQRRSIGAVSEQVRQLHQSISMLEKEGYTRVHVLDSLAARDTLAIQCVPMESDGKQQHGPFDLIGDVHGCFDELKLLLEALGYMPIAGTEAWSHPEGRRLVFVGDLVDRGPKVPEVLRMVMDSVQAGTAFCVPGNHDHKFMRAIVTANVETKHGLAESLEQVRAYEQTAPGLGREAAAFFAGLPTHWVLDDGKLVVAHAGLKESMQGRASRAVQAFALYGDTTGEVDEHGMPIRLEWAADYSGSALVVYGHTPVIDPAWKNRTVNIDTGCVFGGKLTALRYPEMTHAFIPCIQTYAVPGRPFLEVLTEA